MKNEAAPKKLVVKKLVVKELTEAELQQVQGGGGGISRICLD